MNLLKKPLCDVCPNVEVVYIHPEINTKYRADTCSACGFTPLVVVDQGFVASGILLRAQRTEG